MCVSVWLSIVLNYIYGSVEDKILKDINMNFCVFCFGASVICIFFVVIFCSYEKFILSFGCLLLA